jgi:hypothetical protein
MAEPLSPAAQAIWELASDLYDEPLALAAAILRVATDWVLPARMNRGLPEVRAEFLAIAAELEGSDGR